MESAFNAGPKHRSRSGNRRSGSAVCFSVSWRTVMPPWHHLRQTGHIRWRPGRLVPEQRLRTQLPRRIGLVPDARHCLANTAPAGDAQNAKNFDPFHSPPLVTGHTGNAIVLGDWLVQNV
jgi:hypothetical protein